MVHVCTNRRGILPTRNLRDKNDDRNVYSSYMDHASYKKIQEIKDLLVVKLLPSRIPKLTVTFPICLVVKSTCLIC